MKCTIVTVSSLLAFTAHAEITKLGDFTLGQDLRQRELVTTASGLGCSGMLTQSLDRGKVVSVTLTANRACKPAAVEAQLDKEYGGKPIVSTDKTAKLWEGKTGSVMLIVTPAVTIIRLLAPGAGAKRVCFADDGFAAFYTSFKAALGKPAEAAAMFEFPIKDIYDKIMFKDAAALAKRWPKVIDDADKREIANGVLTPRCVIETTTYQLPLPASSSGFEARRVGDRWKWVEIFDDG